MYVNCTATVVTHILFFILLLSWGVFKYVLVARAVSAKLKIRKCDSGKLSFYTPSMSRIYM